MPGLGGSEGASREIAEAMFLFQGVTKPQDLALTSSQTLLPALRQAIASGLPAEPRCDLMNRMLISFGLAPLSVCLYEIALGHVAFKNSPELTTAVDKFRMLCMLEFGNFRYGFKRFNGDDELLRKRWSRWFPDEKEVQHRREILLSRPAPVGIEPIPPMQQFTLGYLAGERSKAINEARKVLAEQVQNALAKRIDTWVRLDEQVTKATSGKYSLLKLVGEAGVSNPGELFSSNPEKFLDLLRALSAELSPVDIARIEELKETGKRNAAMYMAMHDLDVYVATSMREPVDFATNGRFVQEVFHSTPLKELKIRFFDPTQAYLDDRIQKGLMECLMIKRASVTLYNAQEQDTFGKDAELGVTLAQQKCVIVYVARLLDDEPKISAIYAEVDKASRLDRDGFIEAMVRAKLLTTEESKRFLAPQETKRNALRHVLTKNIKSLLEGLDRERIGAMLLHAGYVLTANIDTAPAIALEKILGLEARAMLFREMHPLALQTSPVDGVARGVIVARSPVETADSLADVLLGTMQFRIKEDSENLLLVDTRTESPVRVVTKNRVLTAAFWSEGWGAMDQAL